MGCRVGRLKLFEAIPHSGLMAAIEERIDRLLAVGVGENPRESLSELARWVPG